MNLAWTTLSVPPQLPRRVPSTSWSPKLQTPSLNWDLVSNCVVLTAENLQEKSMYTGHVQTQHVWTLQQNRFLFTTCAATLIWERFTPSMSYFFEKSWSMFSCVCPTGSKFICTYITEYKQSIVIAKRILHEPASLDLLVFKLNQHYLFEYVELHYYSTKSE